MNDGTAGRSILQREIVGPILLLSVDNPPVNELSAESRGTLSDALNEAGRNNSVGAVVLSARGKTFIAEADIKEFEGPPRSPFRAVIEVIVGCAGMIELC